MTERIIYSNDYSNYSEEEIEELSEFAFEDELANLKVATDGKIVAIADIGRWNKRYSGYALSETNLLSQVMTMATGDIYTSKLYYDGHNVRRTDHHHDGNNYILFREIRPNVNADKFLNKIYNNEPISNSTLNRYTKSLKRYVKDIYGW
jgi:hypothetical protein